MDAVSSTSICKGHEANLRGTALGVIGRNVFCCAFAVNGIQFFSVHHAVLNDVHQKATKNLHLTGLPLSIRVSVLVNACHLKEV